MNGPIGSSCPGLLYKKGALKNFVQLTEKQLCRGRLLAKSVVCNFLKKRISELVYFCEFCKIFKNTYFEEHQRATASGVWEPINNNFSFSAQKSFLKTKKVRFPPASLLIVNYFSIFLCLAKNISKEPLLRITFDLCDKVQYNEVRSYFIF